MYWPLYMGVMYVESAGLRFEGAEKSRWMWSLKLLNQTTQLTHVLLFRGMVAAGGLLIGGWVMLHSD